MSLKRLEEFLGRDELDPNNVQKRKCKVIDERVCTDIATGNPHGA